MTTYHIARACECGGTEMSIGEAVTTDGRTIYPFVCVSCGAVQSQYAKAAIAEEHAREHGPLPKVQTRTMAKPRQFAAMAKAAEERRCEVCGGSNAQQHHWAPWHLFGDEAQEWPTSYLCQPCHTRWHQIVTPDMGQSK
jgi:DNA-directed RNA polymerase subunit M/transcription elongation factor TFIIS